MPDDIEGLWGVVDFPRIRFEERPWEVVRNPQENQMALATSAMALAFEATRTRRARLQKPPVWLHPRALERQYSRFLVGLIRDLREQVRQTVIPALRSIGEEVEAARPRIDSKKRQDAWFDRIEPLMSILTLSAEKVIPSVQATALDIGQRTSQWNDKEWQKILRATVGVGLISAEPQLRDQIRLFTKTNSNLITKLQTNTIANIQGKVERGFAAGLRHTEVAKQLQDELKIAENRAKLIARDQVSKLNGRLTQMRQEEAGITKYIWNDVDDVRVRDSHNAMDGKIGRWDNPSVYATQAKPNKFKARSGISAIELHPGEDIQCRCFAEPFMEELAEDVKVPTKKKVKKKKKKVKKPTPTPIILPKKKKKKKKKKVKKKKKAVAKPKLKPTPLKPVEVPSRPFPKEGTGGPDDIANQVWRSRLSSTEQDALDEWSVGGFEPAREYQIKGREQLEVIAQFGKVKARERAKDSLRFGPRLVRAIEPAIERGPKFGGTVYRGMSDLGPSAFEELVNVDIFESKALMSTSAHQDTAEGFMEQSASKSPEEFLRQGRIMLQFRNKSGVNIDGVTATGEEEVLLPKGVRIRITKREIRKQTFRVANQDVEAPVIVLFGEEI